MIIQIKSTPGILPEWAIVELQGNLENYQRVIDPQTEKFVGDLHYEKGINNTVILIIGMHILYGKEITLSKPFGVLRKIKVVNDKIENSENLGTEWIVTALVKKKVIFKSRPRPIVTDMPKSLQI